MAKFQLVALWGCVVYFLVVLGSSAGRAMWGNLGAFRPSDADVESDVVSKDRAAALLNAWAEDYARLTLLLSVGVAMFFCLMVWVTLTRIRLLNR